MTSHPLPSKERSSPRRTRSDRLKRLGDGWTRRKWRSIKAITSIHAMAASPSGHTPKNGCDHLLQQLSGHRRATGSSGIYVATSPRHSDNYRSAISTSSELDRWIVQLQMQGGRGGAPLAPSTVRVAGTVLKKILDRAVKPRRLRHTPCSDVRLPTINSKSMKIVTFEEIEVLSEAIDDRYRAFGHLYPNADEAFLSKINAAAAEAAENRGTASGHGDDHPMAHVVPLRRNDRLEGKNSGGASWNRTSDLSIISAAL